MNRRNLYLFGLLAPGLFVFTAVLGGALRPEYSHLTDTVSELFSPGSPNRLLLSTFYLLFSIFLSLFGIGLLRFVQKVEKHQKLGSWAAALFILVGVLNILTATVFPQDPWGSLPSFPGEMHKVVSGVISLFSFAYMILFGIWLRRVGIARYFWVYSLATILGVILSANWFVVSIGGPMMGLAERVTILIGFQWTIVLSILVLNKDLEIP